jgi:uncharacterized protein with beta-barrel porin domain
MHFAKIDRTAKSHHRGAEVCGRLQSGMNLRLKQAWVVQPYLIADSYNSFEAGYKEQGAGSLDLTVNSHYSGLVRINPAVKVQKELSSEMGCIAFSVYAGCALEIPVTDGVFESQIAAAPGNTFKGRSFHETRNQLCSGASIKAAFTKGPTLFLHYELNADSRYVSNNFDVNAQWSF